MVVTALLIAAGLYLFSRGTEPIIGLFLFIAAGSWLAQDWAIAECGSAPPARRLRATPDRWATLVPVALAVGLAGCLSVLEKESLYVWAYLLGLLLLVGIGPLIDFDWARLPRPKLAGLSARLWPLPLETALVGGLVLVAFLLRVLFWASVPPGVPDDQVVTAVRALDILRNGNMTSPGATTAGRLPDLHAYLAAFLMLPGTDPQLALLLLGAIPGTLCVLLVYVLARHGYGGPIAFGAALLVALNREWVLLSRVGLEATLNAALGLAAVWAAWRAMRSGRTVWFALVGVLCGVELVYLSVGVVAPLFVLLLWALLGGRGTVRRRDSAIGLAISLVVALCVFAPRLLWVSQNAERVKQMAAFYWSPQLAQLGPIGTLQQLGLAFLGIGFRAQGPAVLTFGVGDRGAPLFDPISGVLAMVGAGYLLYRARSPWSAFWFLSGVLGIAVAGLGANDASSNWRLMMAMPALAVGGVLFLAALAEGAAVLLPPIRPAAWAAVLLVLLAVGVRTYGDYFVTYPTREPMKQLKRLDAETAAKLVPKRASLELNVTGL